MQIKGKNRYRALLITKILLSIVFSIRAPAQQGGTVSGQVDDGPYIYKFHDLFNALWVEDGVLFEQFVLPSNYDSIKTHFNFSFEYKDLERTFSYRPRFRQKYKRADSICIISDIHGNYDSYIKLLKGVSVIDKELRWNFGKGHLVILGDIFDRGSQVTELLWHIYGLEKEAAEAGGKVHVLFGNHEYMVLSNDLRYISAKYRETEKITGISYADFFSEDNVLGSWLRSKPVAVKINDILLVHAGISPGILTGGFSISEMNKIFHRDILGKDQDIVFENDKLSLLAGDQGPLWYRGYFTEEGISEEDLENILDLYKVSKIVVGHTTGTSIRTLRNNRIIAIDAGIMNDLPGEILLIRNGELFKARPGGIRSKIPGESEK